MTAPDELTIRRRARLRATGLPVVHCDGEGCIRIETLRIAALDPPGWDPPPGWYLSNPSGKLVIFCPSCRERQGL